jgi:hypothetical protein
MGDKRNVERILVRKPEGQRPLGRLRRTSEDNVKMDIIKVEWGGDRLCGLVVRVLGYRSGGPGSIPGTTRKKEE